MTYLQELQLHEVHSVSGGISDDNAWAASIGVSGVLIGVAIATTGPIAMTAVVGSYAASFISTLFV